MSYSGTAIFGGQTDQVTGSWTNATAVDSTVVSPDISGYGVVAASFVISGTITQGTAIFEVSDDAGTTWWPIAGLQTGNYNQATSLVLTGASASFEFATGAYNLFRVRLNPVILGSGSVAIRLSAEAFPFMTAMAVNGTVAVSLTGSRSVELQDGTGNNLSSTAGSLNVNITGGSSSGVQYTGSPAVAAGSIVTTAASGYDGANVRPLNTDTSGQLKVLVQNTPSVTVSGTVGVTQSTSPWVVSLTSTTITGTVAVTQSTSPWVTNVSQFGGSNVVTGTGASGAGIPRITVSNDSVISSITNTVTVSGTVTANQGTSPWVVNMTQWGSTALGTPTNFGTTPGAVIAGSVNASLFSGTTALSNTSGSLNVNITNASTSSIVSGPDAVGATPTKNPVQTGGLDFGGKVRELQTDYSGVLLTAAGGAAATAFGRQRTAEPFTVFASKFQYDAQPLLFVTSTSGTGTVAKTANESSVTLSTGGTASGATAILQSKQYFPYEPGKTQLAMLTGLMGAIKANVAQRIGYFDANDGVFFYQDGTNLGVAVRTSTSGSPVTTLIPQSTWNLDKLDGTGPSGITVNTAATQIFVIDLQWLGVGRVRFGFDINGTVIYVHQVLNANNGQTSPYMNTATLPLRWEITNTGTAASTTTLKAICGTLISEGGQELPGVLQFSATNGSTTIGVTTRRPILSVQVKTTFNSITNRETIIPGTLNIFNDQSIFFEVVFNGTLTGASFASVGTNSGMNFDTAATSISGGIVVSSGYIGTAKSSASSGLFSNPVLIQAPFTLDFAGTTGDILTIVATSLSGTANVGASVDWIEVR